VAIVVVYVGVGWREIGNVNGVGVTTLGGEGW
jgi:hypothetical protein